MENEQPDAGRDGQLVSRDQSLRRERGHGNIHFPCTADHEQDWQPYPVDPYSPKCDDHTYSLGYIRILTVTARVALLSSPVRPTNEGPRIQQIIVPMEKPENTTIRPLEACISDVPKIKVGKNKNKNWALICRGSKTSRLRYLIFWKMLSNQKSPQGLIFKKIKIKKGVFTRSKAFRMLHARGQSTAVQQQHLDRLHRHTIHTTSAGMAHANGPMARGNRYLSPSWWWGQEQRVVLDFGDADTTRKATGAELWKKSG